MSDSGNINQCCGQTFGHTRWCQGPKPNGLQRWYTTFTGLKFDVFDPDPAAIVIEDIAHALSLKCRYNGHCNRFYSVAEHSWLMSSLFVEPELRRAALLHDAAEAYLCDLPSPIKHTGSMHAFRSLEDLLQAEIYTKFELPPKKFEQIDEADKWMLLQEVLSPVIGVRHPDTKLPIVRRSFPRVYVSGLQPEIAEEMFLKVWKEVEAEFYDDTIQSSALSAQAS